MRLTLLSPTPDKLARLAPKWASEVRKAGLEPSVPADPPPSDRLGKDDSWPPDLAALAKGTFVNDGAAANGSSIAFIASHADRSCLFAADAHADALLEGLVRLEPPVRLNAFKLPHHGSKSNLNSQLLAGIDCDRFLFSTNGNIFGHPDYATVARILKRPGGSPPCLVFNYRSDTTSVWSRLAELPEAPAATIVFPPNGAAGITTDL